MATKGTLVTANDRFKRQFGDWFWGAMAFAALLHGAMFAFFPKMTSGDVSFSVEELQTEFLLQLLDLLAQRRLSHGEAVGGPAEVQLLGHGEEVPEAAEVHLQTISSTSQ